MTEPILKARNLVKRYGKVTALDHADFDLMPGEILAVIGDNGAGKSSMIKAVSGAVTPDEGQVWLDGREVNFRSPIEARQHGIETVYQQLAMSPALSIADNMFMGRELRKPGIMGKVFRRLDKPAMESFAREKLNELGAGHDPEHQSGGRKPVGWPASGRGRGAGRRLRLEGGDPG